MEASAFQVGDRIFHFRKAESGVITKIHGSHLLCIRWDNPASNQEAPEDNPCWFPEYCSIIDDECEVPL